MAAGDLTSVANVKAQAGTLGSSADAVLQSLVTQASTFIAKATDQSFAGAQAFDRRLNGNGKTELYLPDQPVLTITSLTIDGTAIPVQPADRQPGYFQADELLCLYGYSFCRGRKNVRVIGTYGFAAVPKDVEQACIELVVSAYKRVPRGPDQQTQSEQGQIFTFALKDCPAYASRVIDQYRKVVPA